MDIKKIVSELTLEEKAGLCSGKDFWRLKSVERLGIEEIMVSDGPHGLRKQADGGDHTLKELKSGVVKAFHLSEEDLAQLLPSGRQTYFANRVGWARTYLKKAGR